MHQGLRGTVHRVARGTVRRGLSTERCPALRAESRAPSVVQRRGLHAEQHRAASSTTRRGRAPSFLQQPAARFRPWEPCSTAHQVLRAKGHATPGAAPRSERRGLNPEGLIQPPVWPHTVP